MSLIHHPWQTPTTEDLHTIQAQLGRRPEGALGVVVRCRYGQPQVIASAPLRVNGKTTSELPDPESIRNVSIFPTLYWLTCPMLKSAIGRLESAGWVGRLKDELQTDKAAVQALREAHDQTARLRQGLVPKETVERLETEYPGQYKVLTESGVAGMRDEGDQLGVKCLHAHFADYLAGGKNPVGQRVWALLTGGGVDPRGLGECFQLKEAGCPPSQSPSTTQAVIDVGSNSVRLLVAKVSTDGSVQRLASELITTRLGQGVADDGSLGQQAIHRTLQALDTLRRRAAEFGVPEPIAFATSAVREAANRDELLIRAWEEARVAIRVISGGEEGQLSFRGALTGVSVPDDQPVLLCDVGGGSTELIIGDGTGHVYTSCSLPFGAVRLHTAAENGDSLDTILTNLRAELVRFRDQVGPGMRFESQRAVVVGVGGTVTTLASLDQGMMEYDPDRINGYRLPKDRVEHWLHSLSEMPVAESKSLPGMHEGRADIMPYGVAIVREVLDVWQEWTQPELVVSDNDLLQGALV